MATSGSRSRRTPSGDLPAVANGINLKIQEVPLSELHFDPDNPRFANQSEKHTDQALLGEIVRLFGIEDVISSISINGYISTEPLVGIKLPDDQGICIKEGNRRLAALLILANDGRAVGFDDLRAAHPLTKGVQIDPVPVAVYAQGTEPDELLPYLGVRHIVGSKPWDSYAKAAWVALMLESHGDKITIDMIEKMTGDTRGTISRLVEGYYLIQQLIQKDKFNPKDSYKKGRGSAVSFPFSWVYNALGYTAVKEWVGLTSDTIRPNPLRTAKYVEQASELMVFLFGHKSTKTPAAITESREIGDLADCLRNERMVAQLRNRKTVKDVIWSSRSGVERVLQSLVKADDALTDALGSVVEVNPKETARLEPESLKVRNKSKALYDTILDKKKDDD